MASETPVSSPCIGLCELDHQEICRGCGRTIEEIGSWSAFDEASRQQIIKQAAMRLKQDKKP